MPIGDEPKPVPIDKVIRAKGDRIRLRSDSTAGQEFNISHLQGLRHGQKVVRRWEASTGFKILDRAQTDPRRRSELRLRPSRSPRAARHVEAPRSMRKGTSPVKSPSTYYRLRLRQVRPAV